MRKLMFLALFATSASAQTCAHLEYAEIDAMNRDELLSLRCQYTQQWLQTLGAGLSVASNRCSAESARMDRVLARKFNLPDDPEKRGSAIMGMCAARLKRQ